MALDFDMEKLGIKKYEEYFKPKHYKKILKLKNFFGKVKFFKN